VQIKSQSRSEGQRSARGLTSKGEEEEEEGESAAEGECPLVMGGPELGVTPELAVYWAYL